MLKKGNPILDTQLHGMGIMELDVRTWEKGIYLISLWSNGMQMDALKFSVE